MAYSIEATGLDCYPGTTVLVNKLGLQTQEELDKAELEIVSFRSVELLSESAVIFSLEYFCHIHRVLFEDLYDWAGKLRTIDLSKKGTVFTSAEELLRLGNAKFDYLNKHNCFVDLSKEQYVKEIADFYHTINMLHPFREGNGRAQRVLFSKLIERAGYELNFYECDTDLLMVGTIYAAQGVMDPLCRFFEENL